MSPVDGRLLNFGQINTSATIIEQVKGVDINLVDFLGKESSFFKAIENQVSHLILLYLTLHMSRLFPCLHLFKSF